jgi:hypothetical protein
MKNFGMNYRNGVTGQEIVKKFSRKRILQKLGQFYKGMANQSAGLAKAAEDFFMQHPELR